MNDLNAFIRLIDEARALASKHEKLGEFLNSPMFEKLDAINKQLLKAQYGAMAAYRDILVLRMQLWEGN
jgi:hypothetical protein